MSFRMCLKRCVRFKRFVIFVFPVGMRIGPGSHHLPSSRAWNCISLRKKLKTKIARNLVPLQKICTIRSVSLSCQNPNSICLKIAKPTIFSPYSSALERTRSARSLLYYYITFLYTKIRELKTNCTHKRRESWQYPGSSVHAVCCVLLYMVLSTRVVIEWNVNSRWRSILLQWIENYTAIV